MRIIYGVRLIYATCLRWAHGMGWGMGWMEAGARKSEHQPPELMSGIAYASPESAKAPAQHSASVAVSTENIMLAFKCRLLRLFAARVHANFVAQAFFVNWSHLRDVFQFDAVELIPLATRCDEAHPTNAHRMSFIMRPAAESNESRADEQLIRIADGGNWRVAGARTIY